MSVLVEEKDAATVAAAAWALSQRNDLDGKLVDPFVAVLKQWKGRPGQDVRKNVVGLLGRLGPSAKNAVPTLVEMALANGWDPDREIIVHVLGRIDAQAQERVKKNLLTRYKDPR